MDAGKCYLGIFPNTNSNPNTQWYAGAIFLTKYYTFFDMSAYSTGAETVLRLGMGERNVDNHIGEMQYDPESSYYSP